MEQLIRELLAKRINEEAMAVEKTYFNKTDRAVNPKRENPFKFMAGTIPVLVSAPHSVRHMRQKKIKQSDIFTGSLAFLLHRLTGCHALSVVRLYGGDPNFDLPCLYKDYLRKITSANKISLLLDLHGVSSDKDFDIDLGTVNGSSLLNKGLLEALAVKCFRQAGIDRLTSNRLPGVKQNTVTKYAAMDLGIPSIQLEINRKYRAPNQNAMAWCRLVAALTAIINQSCQYLHSP